MPFGLAMHNSVCSMQCSTYFEIAVFHKSNVCSCMCVRYKFKLFRGMFCDKSMFYLIVLCDVFCFAKINKSKLYSRPQDFPSDCSLNLGWHVHWYAPMELVQLC